MTAQIGDEIVVDGHHVGQKPRRGRITDVVAHRTLTRYRVRWETGLETIYFPDSDCTVVPRDKSSLDPAKPAEIDLRPMTKRRIAKAVASFEEDETHTEARITLHFRDYELTGFGLAHRNPHDPNMPAVGEELAAARALSDLAHQLLDLATYQIEKHEGHTVDVHL